MIVCLCHVVTDRTIHTAVDGGARTVADVERACGAGAGCGMCVPTVAEMIESRAACTNACPDCPRKREAVMSPYLAVSGEAA